MDKPTQEEIKKFWEWCGFKETRKALMYNKDKSAYRAWQYPSNNPDDWSYHLPPIDLNNLFTYAVEGELRKRGYHVTYSVDYDKDMIDRGRPLLHHWAILEGAHRLLGTGEDKDPALALFRAIKEVADGK